MARAKNDGRGRLGGREKGTPNKVTAEIREKFRSFVTEDFDTFKKDWETLDAKDKCKFYIDACKFVLPALSSVQIDDVTDHVSQVENMLRSLRDDLPGDSAEK